MSRQALELVLATCRITANYFGPEMMMATIRAGLKNVQIPLNYKERVGVSSVTGNHIVAFKLGLRMIWLILTKRFTTFQPPPRLG
ncbi:MAG: hypothetical protein V1806_15555 [Pseudomonadota bacterium]